MFIIRRKMKVSSCCHWRNVSVGCFLMSLITSIANTNSGFCELFFPLTLDNCQVVLWSPWNASCDEDHRCYTWLQSGHDSGFSAQQGRSRQTKHCGRKQTLDVNQECSNVILAQWIFTLWIFFSTYICILLLSSISILFLFFPMSLHCNGQYWAASSCL